MKSKSTFRTAAFASQSSCLESDLSVSVSAAETSRSLIIVGVCEGGICNNAELVTFRSYIFDLQGSSFTQASPVAVAASIAPDPSLPRATQGIGKQNRRAAGVGAQPIGSSTQAPALCVAETCRR